jgi:CDP-glucose 4,6-dehydratase
MASLEGLVVGKNFWEGKRVFVTGHTGFKGAWLSLWLQQKGAQVFGYSKDIPTNPSLFEQANLGQLIQDERGDINDLDRLRASLAKSQPEIVFHLAAQPLVRLSYEQPLLTFRDNALGTASVLEAVRELDSLRAMVLITTDKVYENLDWVYGYRETDRLGGHDPYSASKAAAEIVIQSYLRSFFGSKSPAMAVARAGNVIGGGDWALDRIVPDAIRAWSQGKPMGLRNPAHTRPWEHVLEPLWGYLILAERLFGEKGKELHGEAFNFGPDHEAERTTEDLVLALAKYWPGASHKVLPRESGSLEKKEARLLRLNCDKAKAILDWHPTLSFDETVEWTGAWYSFARTHSKPEEIRKFSLEQMAAFEARAKGRSAS